MCPDALVAAATLAYEGLSFAACRQRALPANSFIPLRACFPQVRHAVCLATSKYTASSKQTIAAVWLQYLRITHAYASAGQRLDWPPRHEAIPRADRLVSENER